MERFPPSNVDLQGVFGGFLQRNLNIGSSNLSFEADIVIYEAKTDKAKYIIDTKYKAPDMPATSDIAQVRAYAEAKGCKEAVLLYPINLTSELDTMIGDIRIRSMVFSLEGNLEENGQSFLNNLLN